MSIIDSILGQGGIDSTFTDWNEAQNFVIFTTIQSNPRFDEQTKIKLLDMEQQAYEANFGKWLLSEKEEIGRYFNYLKNNFPSITDDQRFLSIYDAAAEVKASEPSVTLLDVEVPEPVQNQFNKLLIGVGVFGLAYLLLKD
jgi:hypothetical protein